MKTLIEFVNVQKWDAGALYDVAQRMGRGDKPWVRVWPGVATEMRLRFMARAQRLLPEPGILDVWGQTKTEVRVWTTEGPHQHTEETSDIVMPDDEFYTYLADLGALWRWIIEQTRDNGPAVKVLNYIVSSSRLAFQNTQNPWSPELTNPMPKWTVEDLLASEYVAPFVRGAGDVYKRIRTCADPDCGKLFIYNRPKQNFCNDDCRYHFHNVVKIRTGYLAEHQRKGRKENPTTYLRK